MDESQPLPHRLLGLALYKTGDLPAAETSLRRATEIDPNDYAGLTVLGNTLFRMNRNEEAEIVYKKAVELNPQSMEALHNLAVLCHRAGRDKEAWSYYQKALENGAQPNPKLESEIPAKAKQAIETVTTKTE
jgi:Flp pilus assembly protein TadD